METKYTIEYAIGKVKAKIQREKLLYCKKEGEIENVNKGLARKLKSLLESEIDKGNLSGGYRVYIGLKNISDGDFKFANEEKIEGYLTEMFSDCNINTSKSPALRGIRVPTTNEIWAELCYAVKKK